MGDSISWAADQARDRYLNSPEHAINIERCDEWNTLMAEIEVVERVWSVTDLRFLITCSVRLDPEHARCQMIRLQRLRLLHGRI